jgi:hypothetical protein
MAIAQIQEGIIVNIEPFTDIPIDDTWLYVTPCYPDIDQKYYSISDPTYHYDANTNTVQEILTPVPKDLDYVLDLKLSDLADLRWFIENNGTVFNGVPIATDDNSQNKILGLRLSAMANSEYTVNFKSPIGFFQLDANTIFALSDAVRDHIQNCFNNEMAHITALNALSNSQAIIDYDISTGWPS